MPNWKGPYVVKKAFSERALILAEMDGKNLPNTINSNSRKEAKVKTRKGRLETKGVLNRKPEKGVSNCNKRGGMQ
ncbi:RNA-directed DNA polymerase (Reverse transcriptase), Ribonuclease H [Gossypium australe]|uniref:RNA-directed DNA polymerase (Reverse transcriptase), Ribonuclease H n=1 Tax=Gossypium australe TaxID=47621 RepID=A0A5B6VHV9_9ROSI|nr:RNA-directed DNA polymerase (Reverse transcriptase), Ribonuclease H [Gossypium australe]